MDEQRTEPAGRTRARCVFCNEPTVPNVMPQAALSNAAAAPGFAAVWLTVDRTIDTVAASSVAACDAAKAASCCADRSAVSSARARPTPLVPSLTTTTHHMRAP